MNEDRISKNVLNMKVKGKYQRLRSRWEEQVRKDLMQREGRPWDKTEYKDMWEDRANFPMKSAPKCPEVPFQYESSLLILLHSSLRKPVFTRKMMYNNGMGLAVKLIIEIKHLLCRSDLGCCAM
jgi:hypothetical protein